MTVANCPGQGELQPSPNAQLFGLMLAHRVPEVHANLQRRVVFSPLADELRGKLLALVGFGASAIELGRLARQFGMRLAAVDEPVAVIRAGHVLPCAPAVY